MLYRNGSELLIFSKTPELLAPAGDRGSFYGALGAGADAVYLGVDALNARRGATNFRIGDLPELCRDAHLQDVRVFLTLNVAILPAEVTDALDLAARAWAAGVDAFIVEDLGLIALLRELMPEAPVHVSTQANVHSSAQIRAYARLGVRRITLARELSVAEIRALVAVAEDCGVEIECFVHGALCVCYSGQCLLSSFIGRRSANRGLCAQPCRMRYEMVDIAGRPLAKPGDYLLSPKDLAAEGLVGELSAAGVASLKIEGRMKSAPYVTAVVSAYRTALETQAAGTQGVRSTVFETNTVDLTPCVPAAPHSVIARSDAVATLQSSDSASTSNLATPSLTDAFNRALTQGYLAGIRGNDLMDYRRQKNTTTQAAQNVLAANATRAIERAEHQTTTLDFTARVVVGKPLLVSVADERGSTGSCEARTVEPARTKAITSDEVREHICRLGGTPYVAGDFELDLSENAGLGFSALHAARRAALEDYEIRRFFGGVKRPVYSPQLHYDEQSQSSRHCEERRRRDAAIQTTATESTAFISLIAPALPRRKGPAPLSPDIIAVAGSIAAARAALNAGAARVHVSALELLRAEPEKGIVPVLPRICHDRELDAVLRVAQRFGAAVASTLGQLDLCQQRGIPAQTHWSLNVTNAYSARELARRGATLIWLSPELSGRQIAEIAAYTPVPVGVAVSGRTELMVTEHCLLMAQGPCDQRCAKCARRQTPTALKDRLNYCFPVATDLSGRSHLYNSVPLDLIEALPEIIEAGVSAIRIDGELLAPQALAKECSRLRRGILAAHGSGDFQTTRGPVTKGHFFRGLV